MIDPTDYESLSAALEHSPDHRVLRRMVSRDHFTDPDGDTKVGIILDTETTGLDPRTDQVIELAMLAFEYDTRSQVCRVVDRYQSFADPGRPIPPEVVQLTGITNEMVAGHTIAPGAVERLVEPAVVVIAHNAAFDRRFAERLHPVFAGKHWACSLSDIPWAEVGIGSAKLDYLAMRFGKFHEAHRAIADCEMLLEILARPLPGTDEPALARLLETARRRTWRVWALGSPIALKDHLKTRGYRWNDGSDGRPKSWYRDVLEADLEAEKAYLEAEIYAGTGEPYCARVTALTRFSDRV